MCHVRKVKSGKFKVTGMKGRATSKTKALKRIAAYHASKAGRRSG